MPSELFACMLAVPHRLLLPIALVDAISGAVGEVSQIVLLYPLETVKVGACVAHG